MDYSQILALLQSFGVPVASLVVIVYAIYRVSIWFGAKLLEPLFTRLMSHLDHLDAQLREQSAALAATAAILREQNVALASIQAKQVEVESARNAEMRVLIAALQSRSGHGTPEQQGGS